MNLAQAKQNHAKGRETKKNPEGKCESWRLPEPAGSQSWEHWSMSTMKHRCGVEQSPTGLRIIKCTPPPPPGAVSFLTLWRSHQKTIDCSIIQTARIKVSVDINDRNGPKENCHCTGLVVSGSRCREKLYSSTSDILYFPSLSLFPLWSFTS